MKSTHDLTLRLSFLGITDEDVLALRSLRPVLERHADELVATFYRHLQSFAPTRALLARPGVTERLLEKQRGYLLSLAADPRDEAYAEERRRIGVTHERVGLEPRWYLGAYALYFSLLVPVICRSLEPKAAERAVVALQRTLMLDAQLAMEAYIEREQRHLEESNRALSTQGRQLAREVEEQQVALRQTTRRARAAEQLAAVGTLVAGLAHEVGTPMSVIQGHAELLESAVTDEKGRWRLQTIREQIDRISRIIQALLSSARPRGLESTPVEVGPLLESTLAFLADRFRSRGITAETDLQAVPSIMADREKLQQLFLNLFLNAVDAMPSGGVLRVSAACLGKDKVEIRVADSGLGMEPQDLDRIFEPFYTTKPAGEGSGLGLVVSHGIVREHDGTIEATSVAGVGTEFRIELPVTASPESV